MAKKLSKPFERYSSSDQYLIALLCAPLKKSKIKATVLPKQENDELFRWNACNQFVESRLTSSEDDKK
ncbi:unnamed protein product [Adineta ricciae]|uniref:Uncharacterized protein n=1 Tax=Adineta ricciae TaxID=249248 RepID=A0A814B7X5_ADIRI|nr:unnamed protein product [Adineta ricciae]